MMVVALLVPNVLMGIGAGTALIVSKTLNSNLPSLIMHIYLLDRYYHPSYIFCNYSWM